MSSSLSRLSLLLGGDLDFERVAAERFDLDFVLQQFGAHALRLGVGLVDLVDRDDDRHLAPPWRGWIASIVCGMTPSSAATTSTTMSVTLAPRARIAVKAAWPGVSMKVIVAARRRGHLIGADMLGDAAGLAGRDFGRGGWRRAARSCRGRHGP